MNINFLKSEEKIIKAYLDVAYKSGFSKITLERLAQQCKISLSNIRYHFQEKNQSLEDLAMLYVLQRGYQFIQTFMNSEREKPKFCAIESYIAANFAWLNQQYKEAIFLLHYYFLASTDNQKRISKIPFVERAQKNLEEMIYLDVGRGLYKIPKDVKSAASIIHSLLTGAAVLASFQGKPAHHKKYQDLVLQTTRRLLEVNSKLHSS